MSENTVFARNEKAIAAAIRSGTEKECDAAHKQTMQAVPALAKMAMLIRPAVTLVISLVILALLGVVRAHAG
jgi:hypothetical protein